MLNGDVDIDVRRGTCRISGEQWAAACGIGWIHESHHIFINGAGGQIVHIALKHIGDIRACEQRKFGIHLHGTCFAADFCRNVGKAFAKHFAVTPLFGTDELNVFAIYAQIHIHSADIHFTIHLRHLTVQALNAEIIETDNAVLNWNRGIGKSEFAAVARQFNHGRIALHKAAEHRCV